jgi:hypothetical protein
VASPIKSARRRYSKSTVEGSAARSWSRLGEVDGLEMEAGATTEAPAGRLRVRIGSSNEKPPVAPIMHGWGVVQLSLN